MNAKKKSQEKPVAPPLISDTKWRKIPLRVRLAVGKAIVSRVLDLYSGYFRKKYHQEFGMKLVSEFVKKGDMSSRRIKIAINKIGKSIDNDADQEEYDVHEALMPIQLLGEIEEPDGRGLVGAVGSAAFGFLQQTLYKNGLVGHERRLRDKVELVDSLLNPVYFAAKEAYDFAKTLKESDLKPDSFAFITLPDPRDPELLPPEIREIAKKPSKTYRPPEHERA